MRCRRSSPPGGPRPSSAGPCRGTTRRGGAAGPDGARPFRRSVPPCPRPSRRTTTPLLRLRLLPLPPPRPSRGCSRPRRSPPCRPRRGPSPAHRPRCSRRRPRGCCPRGRTFRRLRGPIPRSRRNSLRRRPRRPPTRSRRGGCCCCCSPWCGSPSSGRRCRGCGGCCPDPSGPWGRPPLPRPPAKRSVPRPPRPGRCGGGRAVAASPRPARPPGTLIGPLTETSTCRPGLSPLRSRRPGSPRCRTTASAAAPPPRMVRHPPSLPRRRRPPSNSTTSRTRLPCRRPSGCGPGASRRLRPSRPTPRWRTWGIPRRAGPATAHSCPSSAAAARRGGTGSTPGRRPVGRGSGPAGGRASSAPTARGRPRRIRSRTAWDGRGSGRAARRRRVGASALPSRTASGPRASSGLRCPAFGGAYSSSVSSIG